MGQKGSTSAADLIRSRYKTYFAEECLYPIPVHVTLSERMSDIVKKLGDSDDSDVTAAQNVTEQSVEICRDIIFDLGQEVARKYLFEK
jgi:hypothetical protein